MGDRPKRLEKLGAAVTRQPVLVDWTDILNRQQANMNSYSMSGPCPFESEKLAAWYNFNAYSALHIVPVPLSHAQNPEKFTYHPPYYPPEFDMSKVHLQQPQIPCYSGDLPGGNAFF
jgi:hypothetical protein